MKVRLGISLVATAVLAAQVFSAGTVTKAMVHPAVQLTDVQEKVEERIFDTRDGLKKVLPSEKQVEAAKDLVDALGPGVKINWDTDFGTPSFISKDRGYLSGPVDGNHVDIARQWLKDHNRLFGLADADIDSLKVIRDYAMPETGMHPVTFQQTFNGIESVYGGRIIVAVSEDGKVLTVSGNARQTGTLSEPYQLSSSDALKKVIGDLVPDLQLDILKTGTEKGWDVFSGGEILPTVQRVKKAVFLTKEEIRPAFRVLLVEKLNEAYEVVIDGVTGEKLFQRSLVDYAGLLEETLTPEGLVFENYPGAPAGGLQTVKDFMGDKNASPNGWLTPGLDIGITTIGNNADTYANWSNFLAPEGTGIVRPISVTGDFKYNFKDAWAQTNGQTVPPSYAEDVHSATTNLFYHHNLFHDYFYKLGWVEGAGNLQALNFGKGGMDGDPILGLVQAGALTGGEPLYTGRDNAYMLTLPDGIPAWSGMFLWEPIPGSFEGEYADGDYDAGIIYHEYTHALSNRMVAGGESLNSHQAGSMGEGWGDFYGMHYLVKNGLQEKPVVGAYVTGNDERGIRNYALDDAPYQYGDIGYDIVGPEVHADGDIWAAILWHVRSALIEEFGKAEGEEVIEELVLDAMPLSAPDPSMVDMRDAILAADTLNYSGKHIVTLAKAFAQRGLGANAKSEGGDDIDPTPAYDHLVTEMNGKYSGVLKNASTNQPIEDARIIVGQFEAGATAIATTDEKGRFSIDMVEGSYDITIQAKGYGATTIEDMEINRGETRRDIISLSPNYASYFNGGRVAEVREAIKQDEAYTESPLNKAIDDSEGSVYISETAEEGFGGEAFVIDLAGDKPVNVEKIHVSAFKDVAKSRYATLKDFSIEVSEDGKSFEPLKDVTFDGKAHATSETLTFTYGKPRPATPDLHYKTITLASPAKAKYIKFTAKSAQDNGQGFVQIGDIQVFSSKPKQRKVEPDEVKRPDPDTYEGTIQVGNPATGIGSLAGLDATLAVTQNEFVATQNPEPESQGADGYVITLDDAHNAFELKGPGDGSYDLDVYFYDEAFTQIGSVATAGADEVGTIPAGTKYIYVGLYTGANVGFQLKAYSTL